MMNMDYNAICNCLNIDSETLLQQAPELKGTHFFAATATYVAADQAVQMQKIIQAIESVIKLPVYQQTVLALAPTVVQYRPANQAVFMGYDFHLSPQGPQLIEINTNAGGGLLNGLLAQAYRPCCIKKTQSSFDLEIYAASLIAMFKQEWYLQRGHQPLTTIAIVDELPQQQHMYAEFLLFKQLFERHGIKAVIASPRELEQLNGKLSYNGVVIDLIYNRLTDFYLADPAHAHLLAAYLADRVVLTPHPHAYALYANKYNLTLLSDEKQLRAWQLEEPLIQTLIAGIPSTIKVEPNQIEQLWSQRKGFFFKPLTGYGSKGTYRGDRITHKVFNQILLQDYIAQAYAPPSERQLTTAEGSKKFKIDIRNYVYQGNVQLITARLYQGQTTNFRIEGSGFSPVVIYP
jgi:hypothetical protein